MNILSQIFNFETKSFLAEAVLSQIKNEINSILFSFINNIGSISYVKEILNLQKNINKLIINAIVKFINTLDYLFQNSLERKKHYYISKKCPRTIYTIYGEISFERYYYVDKNKNNGFYYIDNILNLEHYKVYDPIIRGILINDAVYTNPNKASYHNTLQGLNILELLNQKNYHETISRQSIYNWIKEIEPKNITYTTIANDKILYIMADEKWIHEQDKNDPKKRKYIMSKCFVVFTGIKRKKGRSKLLGKHVFITVSNNPYKELMDEIAKIYDFEKINTINLLSDAGTWILAGKDELKLYSHNNIVVNTCEFHVKQKINRSTTDKELRLNLAKIIYEDENKKAFISEMDKLIESKDDVKRKEKIQSYKKYILNHWKGIIAMKYSQIKSSMESHISHCIAEHFGSRPKGYSESSILTYLKLQEAKLNGINILDYYLKTYNNSDYIYNEKEVDYSMFDKSTSLLPTLSSENTISYFLNNIAYGQ